MAQKVSLLLVSPQAAFHLLVPVVILQTCLSSYWVPGTKDQKVKTKFFLVKEKDQRKLQSSTASMG